MRPEPRLPRLARLLLRLSRVPGEARADVEGDVHELFVQRRRDCGFVHAHWRLYHDVASLWIQHQPGERRLRRAGTAADVALVALLRDAGSDLRYAVRLFARQPGILLLTIVGLSLGLGIATAAFSIMNAAVLRGEGLVDPDRVPGILRATDRSVSTVWTYDEFVHLREGSQRVQVEAVATDAAEVRTVAAEVSRRSATLAFVSGGYFDATGGRIRLGRSLVPTDEQQAGQPPVVVSYGFWSSTLEQDPSALGRTIWIGRTPATIVGVAERGFTLPRGPLLWMPLTAYGAVYSVAPVQRPPSQGVEVFGRLFPDATLAEAEAQLSGVAAALSRGTTTGESLRVRLDLDAGLGRAASVDALAITLMVVAVISLILLLACANVATVLISTAITREREIGVRAALGATRGRIVRQLVTESLALAATAAAIGLMFAYWTLPVVRTMIGAPASADLAPDLNVYVFLGLATAVTGVAAGLAPAWHGRGADLVTPLKGEGTRESPAAPRRLRSMLVVTQAAISLLLMVMAALFVRATVRATTIDVGFDATGLYAVMTGFDRTTSDTDGNRIRAFWSRAIPAVKDVPGVRSVALAELTPFGAGIRTSITRDSPARTVHLNRTAAEYFETMGLRLLSGRIYTPAEVSAAAPVALVSQSLARAYWGDRSPLGEMLPREIPLASMRPVVIGVVADSITARLHDRNRFAVYEPLPDNEHFARLLIRITPGARGAIDEASRRLREIDAEADIYITSVGERLDQATSRPRMLATLTGFVGLIAIVLCVIGLYGLTASVVGQRTREMGVRLALGAERRDLLRLLMRDSLRPVIVGLAIGASVAALASRAIASAVFFGVTPQDPIAFAGAAVILLAAAVAAVIAPTRRAASVDPAFVLRGS